MADKALQIGYGIEVPKQTCEDKNCPFHGTLRIHGASFVGRVVSSKASRTVSVEVQRVVDVPKYERSMRLTGNIKAHNPDCIAAKEGDIVTIYETRPISKTKTFAVVSVKGHKDVIVGEDPAIKEKKAKKHEKKESAESESADEESGSENGDEE